MLSRLSKSPALIFFLLSVLYFGPALFPAEGWALGGYDMRGLFYPWLEQVRLSITAGQMPWWDTSRFSGYPFLSNPQVAIFYPPTWLAVLWPTNSGISFYYLLHVWLAGWGMFSLADEWIRELRPSRTPDHNAVKGLPIGPFAAGVTFMFAGFFTARILAGHMGLIAVHSWIPWIIWSTGRSFDQPRWFNGVLTGFFLAMALLAGHTTSLLYVGLIWGAFALFWLGQAPQKWAAWLRQLAWAGGTGLLLAAVQLVPLAEISLLASRTAETTFEFATDFSFPVTHLITLLVPEFFGEPTRAGYWSVPNFEELTAYFGVVALLGIGLAVIRPRRQTWFLLILSLIGLLLAFGRYGFLYRFVYDWLPPFRLARAPGRAMFVVVFCAPLLLAEGLTRLRQLPLPWWRIATGVAGGGVLAVAATGAVFVSQHPSDTSGRLWHQLGGWSMAVILLLAAVFLLFRWQQARPANRWRWTLLLVGLIVVDLWTFGYKLKRLEPMTPASFWYEARDLLTSNDEDRILPWGISIFDQNGAGQVGLDSLFGYNALEIGRYTQLVSSVTDPRSTAYDILGATHVVATTPLDQFTDGERPLILVGQAGQAWVYQRSRPLPLVRFVPHIELLPRSEEAIARLHQPDFDPGQTAIVDRPVTCTAGDEAARFEIVAQEAGFWEIQTEATQETLLVIAETAYPGWRVEIDGQRLDTWPVAYSAVRAVCVPAGQHTVTWRYIPQSFLLGGLFSLFGLMLLAAALYKNNQ
ncbi:MAG: hypothetical protein QNJ45_13370 [Ardenticatenaceae bacterium]|nr:hypothetical protein [Ardenticatenaceae bacterium]